VTDMGGWGHHGTAVASKVAGVSTGVATDANLIAVSLPRLFNADGTFGRHWSASFWRAAGFADQGLYGRHAETSRRRKVMLCGQYQSRHQFRR